MINRVAKILSYLFHPLMMPLYGISLIFYYNPVFSFVITPKGQEVIYLIVFITTFLFPALTAWLLLRNGSIKSLQMETQENAEFLFSQQPFIT